MLPDASTSLKPKPLSRLTAGAGLVSQANLDHRLNSFFKQCKDVMYFGETRIQPLCYQDDVGAPCLNVDMARVQASLLASLMQEQTLMAHPEKTGYLILGTKKVKEDMRKEVQLNPIDFDKFILKEKDKDKYLGQIFESNLSTSALATVQDRIGKIKGAAIEIKSIIEECQMQAIAGCMAAWELWEHALLPSLMSGAGTLSPLECILPYKVSLPYLRWSVFTLTRIILFDLH